MTSPIVKAEGGWTAGPWSQSLDWPCNVLGGDGDIAARTDFDVYARAHSAQVANAARIVYAVNNIDAAEADRNTAQASNINAMYVIAARDKEIREKDARIVGLEAALDSLASRVIEVVRVPPLADCCCHLGGAPCAGCQDNANTFVERELVEAAHRALTKMEGSKPE